MSKPKSFNRGISRRIDREILAEKPTYKYTIDQLEALKREYVDIGINTAMALLIAIPCKVLHEIGWNQEQLEALIDAMNVEYAENFGTSKYDVVRYIDKVKKETGLNFKRKE